MIVLSQGLVLIDTVTFVTVQAIMNPLGSSYCADQDDDVAVPSKCLGSLVSNLGIERGSNRESIAPRDSGAVILSRGAQNSGGFSLRVYLRLDNCCFTRYWSLRRLERSEVDRARFTFIRIINRTR